MSKTINVEKVVNWANDHLARTDDYADAKFKAGICTTIENILHMSNNYNGFAFLSSKDSKHPKDKDYYARYYNLPK